MDTQSGSVLCLGEALVDMICERHVSSLGEAQMFVPHLGGAMANVALMAARAGAAVALASGAGDDAWGHWLREQLECAGVGVEHFKLIPRMLTPVAMTTLDPSGEASYSVYGEAIEMIVSELAAVLGQAVAESGALLISSNTLVDKAARRVTMQAREQALRLGRPLIFDPNLHLSRWGSRSDAAASANACVPGALLVLANAAEARLMTCEDDLERAAMALRKAGARNVVITNGSRGAILRGKLRLDIPAVPARVVSTIGAGDALTATLLARLQITGFYEPAIAASLQQAVTIATEACERWGACD